MAQFNTSVLSAGAVLILPRFHDLQTKTGAVHYKESTDESKFRSAAC